MRVFDPAHLNDPVALATEWSGLAEGKASFRSHELVPKGEECLVSQPNLEYKLFLGFFVLLGMGFVISGLLGGNDTAEHFFLFVLIGGFFTAIGLYGLLHPPATLVFDKQAGICRLKGSKHDVEIALSDIYALQILYIQASANDSEDYPTYELNLVFRDAKRLNVLCHGMGGAVRLDAHQLAKFLQVHLWDAAKGIRQNINSPILMI